MKPLKGQNDPERGIYSRDFLISGMCQSLRTLFMMIPVAVATCFIYLSIMVTLWNIYHSSNCMPHLDILHWYYQKYIKYNNNKKHSIRRKGNTACLETLIFFNKHEYLLGTFNERCWEEGNNQDISLTVKNFIVLYER